MPHVVVTQWCIRACLKPPSTTILYNRFFHIQPPTAPPTPWLSAALSAYQAAYQSKVSSLPSSATHDTGYLKCKIRCFLEATEAMDDQPDQSMTHAKSNWIFTRVAKWRAPVAACSACVLGWLFDISIYTAQTPWSFPRSGISFLSI